MKKKYRPLILMKFMISVFFISLLSGNVLAFDNIAFSARAVSLGGDITASIGLGLGDALTDNPAMLVRCQPSVVLFHDNPFGLDGCSISGLSFSSIVNGRLGLGLIYSKEGIALFEEFHGESLTNFWGESRFGFSFSKSTKGSFSWGGTLWQYNQELDIKEDPEQLAIQQWGLTMDLGLLWGREKWGMGFTAKNIPLQSDAIIKEQEYILGLRIGTEGNIAILSNIIMLKDAYGNYETVLNGGIEGWILPNFALRIGLDRASMVTAGFGAKKGNWEVNYAYKILPIGNAQYITTGFSF